MTERDDTIEEEQDDFLDDEDDDTDADHEALGDYFGHVVEVGCLRDGCDGKFAWLIGRTRHRNCRVCQSVHLYSEPKVRKALLHAAADKVG